MAYHGGNDSDFDDPYEGFYEGQEDYDLESEEPGHGEYEGFYVGQEDYDLDPDDYLCNKTYSERHSTIVVPDPLSVKPVIDIADIIKSLEEFVVSTSGTETTERNPLEVDAKELSEATATDDIPDQPSVFSKELVAEIIESKDECVVSTSGTGTVAVSKLQPYPLSVPSERNPVEVAGVIVKELSEDSSPSTAIATAAGVDDYLLDTEIPELHLYNLAGCFDGYDDYMDHLGLNRAEQSDVRKTYVMKDSTQSAVAKALRLWRQRDPSTATFRELLKIIQNLVGKALVVKDILDYIETLPAS